MNKHIFKLEEETNKVWNEETKSFEEFIELNKKENMEEREIKITLEQAKAMLEGFSFGYDDITRVKEK